ncbi:MobC family plasmid mobilization relaxosome protein [Streptomyces sp. NBC_01259]|uniref:plasmid mobilization protein n=1 Tax=Streptomyces sp. NBC_01259 TaxID=2903800 RepID=UPI003255D1A9
MTNPLQNRTTPEPDHDTNSISGGASWCKSIAPVGSNALASPAPGVAGADRHRGAPIRQDATEGGSHPDEGESHSCHSTDCTHATPPKSHVQQRERLRHEKKRMHQPSCRMNDDEYQLLARAAAACNMSIANYLARAALKAARNLDFTAAEIAGEREMLKELFDLRTALNRIGNNLNQVAAALNSDEPAPQARAVLAGVDRVSLRVDALVQRYLDGERSAA